jgi:uncharacterized membrane protein YukC
MNYDNLGQPIPSNINPHYLGVALIALVVLMMIPIFFYWNKAQRQKDCLQDSKMSYEYPNYQAPKDEVEMCAKLGIDFRP